VLRRTRWSHEEESVILQDTLVIMNISSRFRFWIRMDQITRDDDFHEGKDDESPLFTPSSEPPDDSCPNNEGFANDF